jgi:hypothetical protein
MDCEPVSYENGLYSVVEQDLFEGWKVAAAERQCEVVREEFEKREGET